MRLRLVGALCALLLGGVACAEAEPDSEATTDPAVQASLDPESVDLASSLAQSRGHAAVALELYEAEDAEGPTLHAGHPLAEVFDPLQGELDEHGVDVAALEEAYDALASAVADEAPVDEVEAAVEEIDSVTLEAADVLAGESAGDPGFTGSVVSSLLATVAHEYGEAVAGDGSIGLLEEYQDAYGFKNEAKSMYEVIRGDVEAASEEEAAEIDEAFADLDAALPQAPEPDEAAPAEDVVAATELIAHELEETVGALPLEESDPTEVVAEIHSLLDEIQSLYADGETEEAAELAAQAYLENYEVIEAGVIQAAPEVNEELEPLLGAELRRQMQEGASAQEVSSMIEQAHVLLDEALAAVEGA